MSGNSLRISTNEFKGVEKFYYSGEEKFVLWSRLTHVSDGDIYSPCKRYCKCIEVSLRSWTDRHRIRESRAVDHVKNALQQQP